MQSTAKYAIVTLCAAFVLAASVAAYAQDPCPCIAPDNRTGTATLPAQCPYEGRLVIIDGLPAGSSIEIAATLKDFANINEFAGGTLGGTLSEFNAIMEMQMVGNGALAGFNRLINMPVSCSVSWAPRTPGDAVQDFDAEINGISGELFGDPDFDLLRLRCGDAWGLPSPGHTTLTQLGTDFVVDSFFDVEYQIEFVGQPGSLLQNMAGTTQSQDRFQLCPGVVSTEERSWGHVKSLYR
jgi:hypothetical protein